MGKKSIPPNPHKPFSNQLQGWLQGPGPKTLAALDDVFAEKSIAIAILLLMFLPALPLPTGGLTHVFEIIAMLLALEMIIGRRSIWLPKKWRQRSLGQLAEQKVLPKVVKYIRWFERFSRPRYAAVLQRSLELRLIGCLTLLFTLFAFISPPFSGLDTLPSLGVVVMMLAIILGDSLILLMGVVIGVIGTGLTIGLGAAFTEVIRRHI